MIQENEYDFDSSDEEDVQNTIGNVPMEWYQNTPHIGYDITGRPLMKMSNLKGALDSFLENVENADKCNVIKDPLTGQTVVLSEKDILLIKGLCSGRGYMSLQSNNDEYVTDWFTRDVMETPVSAHPPQKRSFIPSILDKKRVSRMIYAIKIGRMKMPEVEDKDKILDGDHEFIMSMNIPDVWRDDYNKKIIKHVSQEYLEWLPKELHPDYQTRYQSIRQIIRPPPETLPSHAESYNPPEEYLLDDKEKKIFVRRFFDPSYNPCRQIDERPLIPTVYSNLRSVPYSAAPILDKQKRLRDLSYAARVIKDKVNSSTEKMLKQDIPPYSEMRPFPNEVEYSTPVGDVILSISLSYCGQFIATIGYEHLDVYITSFGHQATTPHLKRRYPISMFNDDKEELTLRNPSLSWNPYSYLLAVAIGSQVRIINPLLDQSSQELESHMKQWWSTSLSKSTEENDEPSPKKAKLSSNWSLCKAEGSGRLQEQLSSLLIELEETVLDMSWHSCGDYLLTISGKGKATNSGGKVQLHRLSKCASQTPFGDSSKHVWLTARFHCQKNVPLLFLAEFNTSNIQVYDLSQKKLIKTLQVTGKPSTMEMHPRENHLIVGTFEGKICWFDLDMGISPFKTLNVNHNSVRSIALHQKYPLMACTTANGTVVTFYAKVFNTYDKNPVVVPVSLFEKLDKAGDLYSACFHPDEVKLYSGGRDKSMKEISSSH